MALLYQFTVPVYCTSLLYQLHELEFMQDAAMIVNASTALQNCRRRLVQSREVFAGGWYRPESRRVSTTLPGPFTESFTYEGGDRWPVAIQP